MFSLCTPPFSISSRGNGGLGASNKNGSFKISSNVGLSAGSSVKHRKDNFWAPVSGIVEKCWRFNSIWPAHHKTELLRNLILKKKTTSWKVIMHSDRVMVRDVPLLYRKRIVARHHNI